MKTSDFQFAQGEIALLSTFDVVSSKPSKGDQRKRAMIEAAIHSIAVDGIENTTYEAIGKVLKVRPSHVAYYFPDKKQLITAAIKFISATAQDLIVRSLEGQKRADLKLKIYIESYFNWVQQYPQHAAVFFLFFHYCSYHEGYRGLYRQVRDAEILRLSQILKYHSKSKRVTGSEIERQALSIQVLLSGMLIEVTCRGDIKNTKNYQKIAYQAALEMIR